MIILLAAAALAAQAQPTLGTIRMHLFYEETGRLSPDISPPADFAAWNSVIGEGSAEEAATDVLIVVEVRGPREQMISTPLTLTARGPNNRMLGQRRWDSLLMSERGRVAVPLWLRDASCAGDIRVTATLGRATRSETMAFNCGE